VGAGEKSDKTIRGGLDEAMSLQGGRREEDRIKPEFRISKGGVMEIF